MGQQSKGEAGPRLDGRTVLVTGAGQGLGRAMALRAAGAGARVVASDIDLEAAEETCAALDVAGAENLALRCDVTDPDEVGQAIEDVLGRFSRLDCAINNAGTEGVIEEIVDYPLEVFERVIRVNLAAVFICMQAELGVMKEQGSGAIVNVSSIAGFAGFPNFSAYNASKHGVVGLTRTAALEYATTGIRVNSVAPGFCETPMVTDRGLEAKPGSDDYRQIEVLHPMDRLGRPEEIAEAAVWLCSDAASFVTGHSLAVDGGYLAR
jgi:NAD(P)-dependent dehydrogenase (short-subunit alcohol dehydrogenase family)